MYLHLIAVPLFAVILLWSLQQFYGRHMRGRDDSMMLVMTLVRIMIIITMITIMIRLMTMTNMKVLMIMVIRMILKLVYL